MDRWWLPWGERLRWPLLLVALALMAGLPWSVRRLPRPAPAPGDTVEHIGTDDQVERWDHERWSAALYDPAAGRTEDPGPAERFRLAGTFTTVLDTGGARRKAVIDDLATREQLLLNEGEYLDRYLVEQIHRDQMVLAYGGRQTTLQLTEGLPRPGGRMRPATTVEADDEAAGEYRPVSRFGVQLSENRWTLQREALLEYYNEVLHEPARIAALYASLRPAAGEAEEMRGYAVHPVGEEDFFQAFGLAEGDVIRSVNSMPMTRQQRAEYFLVEFMQDRLSALVLDIERDGEERKLIYLIR